MWFEAAQVEERSCWRLCSKVRRESLHSLTSDGKRAAEDEEEEDDGIEGIGPSEKPSWVNDVTFQDGLKLTRQV